MSFPDESLRETLKDNCSNFRSILVDKRSFVWMDFIADVEQAYTGWTSSSGLSWG